ncbi:unnamed protein product [Blepharisma stoltei]|uniref:FYVE-type domain-containing protein n=1 Tax=Blepharisma stoltei TaxID=1481888 RepID=A0AAU9K9S1_9CILI|nr:unnamed protein product [Blepharisma stoltei]
MDSDRKSSSENSSENDQRDREESVWSNPDSYVGSRTTSVTDRSQLSISPAIKPGIDRNAYKNQKYCIVCEIQVAKHGVVRAKRFSCKFCYNAVCGSCSPLTLLHPETFRPERVCMNCFYSFIEEKFKNSGNEEFKIRLESEIQDKNMEIAKKKLAEVRCAQLEEDIDLKDQELIKLKIELEEEKKRAEKANKELNSNQHKAEKEIKDEKFSELERKLNELKIENTELKKKLESISALQASQKSGACCTIQ